MISVEPPIVAVKVLFRGLKVAVAVVPWKVMFDTPDEIVSWAVVEVFRVH
jgi:hypothetical protein